MVRKPVSQETQAKVLAACRRRCAICFGLHRDRGTKAGQIAHLGRDAANSLFENLVFLCLEHHDLFDTRTRSVRDIKAPYRKFLPLQAAPGLVDGWLRPGYRMADKGLMR